MSAFAEYGNGTVTVAQMNGLLSLISLLGARFVINSFTVVSDSEAISVKTFQKMAFKCFLEMSHQSSVHFDNLKVVDNAGYIFLEKSDDDISKIINTKIKLVIAVYKVKENNISPQFLANLAVPPSVAFFVVLLSEKPKLNNSGDTAREITATCFRLYKPLKILPPRAFPVISYDGLGPKRFWVTKETDWNSFEKETRNMDGITITLALASPLDKKQSIDNFWTGKNSFFWREMSDHLRFRTVVHFQPLHPPLLKNITSVYISLLMTVADGLAVLPVLSSERDHQLDFILTGCDSKYHLMVKTPEYVHSWQSILKPLALKSWICAALAALCISTVLWIVSHKRDSLGLSSCLLMTFGFLCSQGSPNIPRSCSGRIVCYVALIFSLLLYQFYTSNFYSLLSTKKVKLPFTSLEQFMAKGTHKMYIHPDTALYAQITSAKSGMLRKLWHEFLRKDPSHQLRSSIRARALNNVCKGKGAVLGLPFQTIYFKELQCKLVPVNSGYYPTNIITVVRKNFPFKSQFKFVHLRLLEAGISHKFRDEFLNFKQQHKTMSSVTNEPVSLEHVIFPLGFHVAFIVISLLVLLVEVLAAKSIKNKKYRVSIKHFVQL